MLSEKEMSWDETFMNVAREMATHSTCCRWNVGAALVRDRRILSTGYNGSPQGRDHCVDIVRREVARGIHPSPNLSAMSLGLGIYVNLFGEKFVFQTDDLSMEMLYSHNFGEFAVFDLITQKAIKDGWINKWHSEWSDTHELHAEVNCMGWAAREGIKTCGSTLYVTLSPCVHCAKVMLAAGITRVVYSGPDRTDKKDDGIILLHKNKVELRRI